MISLYFLSMASCAVFFYLTGYIVGKSTDDARAVRAFFKGITESSEVYSTRKLDDGEWVIHARSLDERGAPFSVVPTRLMLQLSDDTRQVTPWTDIVVDPPSFRWPWQTKPTVEPRND